VAVRLENSLAALVLDVRRLRARIADVAEQTQADETFPARQQSALGARQELSEASVAATDAADLEKELSLRLVRLRRQPPTPQSQSSIKSAEEELAHARASTRRLAGAVSSLLPLLVEFPELLPAVQEIERAGNFSLVTDSLASAGAVVQRCLADFGGELHELTKGGAQTRHRVFKATEPESGRDVALKEFRGVHEAESRRRFLREVALLRTKCRHPHIVPCEAVFFEPSAYLVDARAFLQMPFYAGGTLADWALKQETPFPVARALCDVAKAVAHLHAQGVVHCDIKPANILLSAPGPAAKAVLADFDVSVDTSVRASVLAEATRTLTLAVRVTPAYAAPELAQSGAACTAATDIFAFGKTAGVALLGMSEGWAAEAPVWSWRSSPWAQLKGDSVLAVLEEAQSFVELAMLTDAQQRPSASALLEHALFRHSLAWLAVPRLTCVACWDDDVPADRAARCLQNAIGCVMCCECFSGHVADKCQASAPLLEARGRDNFVPCLCGSSYSPRMIQLCATEAAFEAIVQARERIVESRMALANDDAIATARARWERDSEKDRRVQRHVAAIVEDILSPKCPGCNMAYGGHSGCTAVKCEPDDSGEGGCGAYFCAWCFSRFSDSLQCHNHVTFACGVEGHTLFPQKDAYPLGVAKFRADRVNAYISTHLLVP
jgi:hypothetical protein